MSVSEVISRIEEAAKKVNRDPNKIKLICVSKTRTASEVAEAAKALKLNDRELLFGENYWQELEEKLNQVPREVKFHFIGRLQSNKIKELLDNDIFIQSIAKRKHIEVTSAYAAKLNKVVKVFLQVNISEDPKKSGFSFEEARRILSEEWQNIEIIGLMTIPENVVNKEELRSAYSKMRELRDNSPLILSMGMSDDLEIAIEEGSDMVRVGTAVFGERVK